MTGFIKFLYLVLALAGVLIPAYILTNSENIMEKYTLYQIITEFALASVLTFVLIIFSVVSLIFILREGQRLGMKNFGLFVVLGFLLSFTCALPLFLYAREVHLEKQGAVQAN